MEPSRIDSDFESDRNTGRTRVGERTLASDERPLKFVANDSTSGSNVGADQAQSLSALIDLTKVVAARLEEITLHVRKHESDSILKNFAVEDNILQAMGTVAKTSLEGVKSGSVIAIFLAALDVALLTYAHELVTPYDPASPPTTTVRYAVGLAICCFFLSLFYSLFVVVVGSTLAYAHYIAMSKIVETTHQSMKRTISLVRKGNEMTFEYGGGLHVTLKPDILQVTDDQELKVKVFTSSKCIFEQCARMIVAGTWPALIWLFIGLFVLIWAGHSLVTCIGSTIISVLFLLELVIYHLRDFDFAAVIASSGICIKWFGAVAIPFMVRTARGGYAWAKGGIRSLVPHRYDPVLS